MPHTLSYIGRDNNTYVVDEDGKAPDFADRQSLNIGDYIEGYTLSGSRNLAEQTNELKLLKANTHEYYINGIAEQTKANNMPLYINRWVTSDGYGIEPGVQLTSEIVTTYFNDSNMDLYANWGEPYLIRVIIYTEDNEEISNKYEVALSSYYSYDNSEVYKLTDNFKSISDGNVTPGYTDGETLYVECGEGDGCPNGNGVRYFAVKNENDIDNGGNGDYVQLIVRQKSGYSYSYIPYFEMDKSATPETPIYKCFVSEGLVREDADPKSSFSAQVMTCSSNGTTWVVNMDSSSRLCNIYSDKTIFVPLIEKPLITLMVSPLGSGTVSGGGYYMPGSQCTITATPQSGYAFVNWTETTGVVSTSQSYSFYIGNMNKTITANFSQSGLVDVWTSYYTDTYMSEFNSFSWFTLPNQTGKITLTYTPSSHSFPEGTVLTFGAMDGIIGTGYRFFGWYTYTGQTPNPRAQTDTWLSSDLTYPVTVGQQTIKIYAFFDRA